MIHADSNIIEAVLSAIPEPFFVFDEEGHYVKILGGIDRSRYHDGLHLIGKRIHDVIRQELADQYLAQIKKAILTNEVLTYSYTLSARDIKGSEDLAGPEGLQSFEAHISPIKKIEGQPRMVVWIAFNITPLQNALKEKDSLIFDLQQATREIKTLQGIIPICSYCKNIRDDKGYWTQLEAYISENSDADLSHGICPECVKKYFPEL
ncbi:MAG: hypothetical protein A2X81_11840 [Desulfobacterales bacterium GWB2_56_26]|nr:MAG: hypothetical protein A2X81_11840 [Desulfobacterales bacterium GWB2_56_26]